MDVVIGFILGSFATVLGMVVGAALWQGGRRAAERERIDA